MIIIKIYGGLGNQMFQYALARSLSLTRNIEFKLDINSFQKNKLRSYNLSHFNIVENFADEKEINQFINNNFINRIYRRIFTWLNIEKLFAAYYKRACYVEPFFYYDANIKKAKDETYLSGYWQSEKYFKPHENQIRKDFTLRNPLSKQALVWSNKIQAAGSKAISIHIRRGDYITNKTTNQFHETCNLDYYKNAIRLIRQKVYNPLFFIFSDDIVWTKKNLKIDSHAFYVSNPKKIKDFEEMILMSQCKHNIIANSSFSWWGAWLNPSRIKTVISPQKWFSNEKIDTNDLIPKLWLRI